MKVSGFRIEIDEIENRLLQIPGIRAGAVVVAEQDHDSLHLVCFYSGARPIDSERLRAELGQSLPAYMVPATFHWLDSLPLTANSKVDRLGLLGLAGELVLATQDVDAPITANERRIATAWARVLGIPEDNIGRQDHFFDRGGTSLSAVKLAIALDRAVSLNDVIRHPVLVDQAALLVPHE